MSLDVYLEVDEALLEMPSIPIRINGSIQHITRERYAEMFPGREPVEMPMHETHDVYSANITHNLNTMAAAAGLYACLWRPDESGYETAAQLIKPLHDGLRDLRDDPEYFKQLNPPNGWGDYEQLVGFVESYLAACTRYPDARVRVSR